MTATAEISPSEVPIGRNRFVNLRAEHALEQKDFISVRREAALEGCKWDAQVGDITTLAPFPLVLKRSHWKKLALWAEQLAAEAVEAEIEIAQKPELLRVLALPRQLQQVLADEAPITPSAGRVIRFDFHLTTEGWRISEANSDVPGGFSEASHFSQLMAKHYPGLSMAGNPGKEWADALVAAMNSDGAIALLSAPGYMEDHQVVSYLASLLRGRGCRVYLAKPEQLHWEQGQACLETSWYRGRLDAVMRFYQAEWLARLPTRTNWGFLFRRGRTPVANPALAVITESKRFPLLWDRLSARLPTWRALLPETLDPRETDWSRDETWLVKTAMCNTGDTVSIRGLMQPNQWLETKLSVLMMPHKWVAQRRFQSRPLSTPMGPRHVCVGVYTVNGHAAGAYARLATKPLIDFAAVDVALLIEEDD